jgi:hypothetical protein
VHLFENQMLNSISRFSSVRNSTKELDPQDPHFKDILGEYNVATKKLERTLEKTRQDMIRVMKGVSSLPQTSLNPSPAKKVGTSCVNSGDVTEKSSVHSLQEAKRLGQMVIGYPMQPRVKVTVAERPKESPRKVFIIDDIQMTYSPDTTPNHG